MHLAEKIRQTGTEGMSMAQDYGNYPPYARNPILIKTYRGGEQNARFDSASSLHCFILALFSSICLHLFFWLDREGVWRGVILSIKHCAQEHAVENTLGVIG